jgi:BirA family biotin operon repressor/biotin-[acetyl-CoA-carboxylase] ligase
LRSGWTLEHFDLIPTTQDIALQRALDGASDRHIILADQQTQARGRGGNIWLAPKGNLYTTLIVRPTCEVQDYGLMSFLTAVAVEQALQHFIERPRAIQLKWPNDVLCEGKKIAGILLEVANFPHAHTPQKPALLIGIGVNIAVAPAETATSLQELTHKKIAVNDFMQQFLLCYDHLDHIAMTEGFSGILSLWSDHAKGMGDKISVRLPQEKLEGIFESLEASGALKLKLPDGSVRLIHSGEVYFGWD